MYNWMGMGISNMGDTSISTLPLVSLTLVYFYPVAKPFRSMYGKMTVRGGGIGYELVSMDNFVSEG